MGHLGAILRPKIIKFCPFSIPFPIKISVLGVSIKMRTGKILNSKTDWDAPSLITLERNIRRGL